MKLVEAIAEDVTVVEVFGRIDSRHRRCSAIGWSRLYKPILARF